MLDAQRVRPEAARWSARTITGDSIIAALVRAKGIGRTNGNCRRLVSGAVYLTITFLACFIYAIVSGCCHNHDTGIDQATHGSTDWVVFVGINRWGAEAHIHHPNVVGDVITHHPIKCSQNGGHGA